MSTTPTRTQLAVAFSALYIVWGSTYLAMRLVVTSTPAFAAASLRFLIAGGLPYLVLRLRGERAPTAREWRHAAVSGVALFCGGNGLVMWLEQRVPSGLTALVIATSPVWFALFDWLRPGGSRPHARVLAGIALGTIGAAMLADPREAAAGVVPLGSLLGLLLACMTWVAGSLYGKYRPHHPSIWLTSAQHMLCGSVGLLLLACLSGELPRLRVWSVDPGALGAFAYLVVFGSWLGFGAYAWLLARVPSAQLSTYAYVNPLIALALGAWWLDEPFTERTARAAAVILLAVATVQSAPKRL